MGQAKLAQMGQFYVAVYILRDWLLALVASCVSVRAGYCWDHAAWG